MAEWSKRDPDGYFGGYPYWYGTVHPKDLVFEANYRQTFDETQLDELATDIAMNGLCNEIMVMTRGRKFIVIDGGRRGRCAKRIAENPARYKLGDRVDPYSVRVKLFTAKLSDEELLSLQISANLHEKPPPEQEAEALYYLYLKAKKRGWTLKRFAKECGKSEERIRSYITFMEDLEVEVMELIRNQDLNFAAGQLLAKVTERQKQLEIARFAVLRGEKTAKSIRPRVLEWLQSQVTEQLEMRLVTSTPGQRMRKALYDKVALVYYSGIQYLDAVVRSLDNGFLAKDVLTEASIQHFLRALSLRSRILVRAEISDPLHQLAVGATASCDQCVLVEVCPKPQMPDRDKCTDMVMDWFYGQVSLRREDANPKRQAG